MSTMVNSRSMKNCIGLLAVQLHAVSSSRCSYLVHAQLVISSSLVLSKADMYIDVLVCCG